MAQLVGVLVLLVTLWLLFNKRGKTSQSVKEKLASMEPAAAARWLLDNREELDGKDAEISEALSERELLQRWKRGLDHGDAGKQADIAMAVAVFGGENGRKWLLQAWDQNSPGVQLAVARALAATAEPELLDELLPLLQSERPGLPTRVAEVIMALGDKAVPTLVNQLRNVEEGREIIIQLLGELEAAEAAGELVNCLSHSQPGVRREAVIALGKLETTPEITAALLHALHDGDWRVRAQAARVVGIRGIVEAIPSLKKLTRDERWEVSTQAEKALQQLYIGGTESGS
ncbi:MAG: HEAT repeat domain-containing protein [Thermoanaerobacteraceae bacterium]|nr:HEAT repeat domain-containing protein [Thermoanaerobacteraceae bacterium]